MFRGLVISSGCFCLGLHWFRLGYEVCFEMDVLLIEMSICGLRVFHCVVVNN